MPESVRTFALVDALQGALSAIESDSADAALRRLIDHLGQGILMIAADGSVEFMNSAAVGMLGAIPPDSKNWQATHIGCYLSPGNDRIGRIPINRALAGASPSSLECVVRNKHSPLGFWVRISARPVRTSAGFVKGAICALEDISQERNQRASHDEATRSYQVLFERNVAGIVRSRLDGTFTECNQAYADMLGLANREQIREYRAADFYVDPKLSLEIVGELQTQISSTRELALKRTDGRRISVLMNATLLEGPRAEEGAGEIIATLFDITDRKHWEQTLHESEERFTAFMHHLPGIAFINDGEGRYLYCNEAADKATHGRMRVPGASIAKLWPADLAARLDANNQLVLETGRSYEFIESLPYGDGFHSWLVSKFPMLDIGDRPLVGAIGIDITERQLMEERLQQSEKMEAIGRLAGGVAHDFNNLLTLISGYGQMAKEALTGGEYQETVQPYLDEVLAAAARAASLTGQLLAFSRRQVVQARAFDIRHAVRHATEMLKPLIGEHIDLKVVLPEKPCNVLADPSLIEQMLVNIAINGRDAMPEGGRLQIQVRCLQRPAVAEPSGPCVLLEIEDDGKGMDEVTRSRLFEPFFSMKEKGKTTGLGLSTAYGIVKQSGGEILVESRIGAGSRFSVYLPQVDAPPESRNHELSTVQPAVKVDASILLVEDEKPVRDLVRLMLTTLGYRVEAADGGIEALKLFREKKAAFDLLLTDVIMPQMNGRDLSERLREQSPDLKIIYMSGYTDDMLARQGVIAEGVVLLQKPFSTASLARVLQSQLQKQNPRT
jgi:two-component system cell cycle sensor histidine kinase/response regulator CckA